VTSSPGYPQSNGKAENAVKQIKNLMKKCAEDHSDVYLALLELRNIPSEQMKDSPAQRLFSRRTRTLLPSAKKLLQPQTCTDVKTKLIQKKAKQQQYYNRHTVELEELRSGDAVRFRAPRSNKWIKATVDSQIDVRSYRIRTETGKVYRRNRKQLRKSAEVVHIQPQFVQIPLRSQTGSVGGQGNKISNAGKTMSPSVVNKPVVAQRQNSVKMHNTQAPMGRNRPTEQAIVANQATGTGQEKVLDAYTPRKTGTGVEQRRTVVTPGRGNTTDTPQQSVETNTQKNATSSCTRSGRIIRKPSYLQDFVQK
jgi:hypothetical protein